MKAYKEYLAENKRTYDFRVRVANCDLTPALMSKMEIGLKAFDLVDISKPKSQPATKTNEFSQLGPVERHQFEIKLNYPATSEHVKATIHSCCGIAVNHLVVKSVMEDDLQLDQTSGDGSVNLATDKLVDQPGAQDTVAKPRVDSLLKQLMQTKTELQAHADVNSGLQAESMPKEKPAKTLADIEQNNTSPVSRPTHKINPRGK